MAPHAPKVVAALDFKVYGLDCAEEASLIKRALREFEFRGGERGADRVENVKAREIAQARREGGVIDALRELRDRA